MARFYRILLVCILWAAFLCPVTAGAYVAYSTGYSSGYGGGSYYVARSQPVSYYTVSAIYPGCLTPNPTPTQVLSPAPVPAPNPASPYKPAPKQPDPKPTPAPDPAPVPGSTPVETTGLTQDEQLLLNLVNNERAKQGLPGLSADPRLTRLARLKSQDMLDLGYFDHLSPTYGRFGDMLRSADIKFYLAAENIGMGGSISRIFNAFMASPGHSNKIRDARYTLTGIGIVYKQGKGYRVTQLFLKPR